MPRTIADSNALRTELIGASMYHTSEPLELLPGEEMTVTYALAGESPTITVTATLRVAKTYDPLTDSLSFIPYQLPLT